MDPSSDDLIEKLLQTSGLSCDDLLLKLQQYKIKVTKSTVNKNLQEQDTGQLATTSGDNKNILPNDDSRSIDSTTVEKGISSGMSKTATDSQNKRLCGSEKQKLLMELSKNFNSNTSSKNQPENKNESLDNLSDLKHPHKKAEKVKGTSSSQKILNSEEKIESVSEICEVSTDTLFSDERTEIVQENTQNVQILLKTNDQLIDETLKESYTSINECNNKPPSSPSTSEVFKVETTDKKKCERSLSQSHEEENSKTLVKDIREEESYEIISANCDTSMKTQKPVSKSKKIETKNCENSGSFVNSKTLSNKKDETIDEHFRNDKIAIGDDISNQEERLNIREELLENVSTNLGVLTKNVDEPFLDSMVKTFESSETAENNPLIINKENETLKSILRRNIKKLFSIKSSEVPKETSYAEISVSNSQLQPRPIYEDPSKNGQTARNQDELSSEKKIELFQETFTVVENSVNDTKQSQNENQLLEEIPTKDEIADNQNEPTLKKKSVPLEKTFPILVKSQSNQSTNKEEYLKKDETVENREELPLRKIVPSELNLNVQSDQSLNREESTNETVTSTKNIEIVNDHFEPVLKKKIELFEKFSTNVEEEFLKESSNNDETTDNQGEPTLKTKMKSFEESPTIAEEKSFEQFSRNIEGEFLKKSSNSPENANNQGELTLNTKIKLLEESTANVEEKFLEQFSNSNETANNQGEPILKTKMKLFEVSPANAEEKFLEQFCRKEEEISSQSKPASTKEINLFGETSAYVEIDYSNESTVEEKIELLKKISRTAEEQFLEGSSKSETLDDQTFPKKIELFKEFFAHSEEEFLDESSKNDNTQYNQDESSDSFEETSKNFDMVCQNEPTLKKKTELSVEHSAIAQENFLNESSKNEILENLDESTSTNKMKLFEESSADAEAEFLDETSRKDEILNEQDELFSMKIETSKNVDRDCQNEPTLKKKTELFVENSTIAQEKFFNESSKNEILENLDESTSTNKTKLFEESSAEAEEEFLDETSRKDEILDKQDELSSMKKIDSFEETSADVEIDCQDERTLKKQIELFEEHSVTAPEEFLNKFSENEILDNQDEPASMKKTDPFEKVSTDVEIDCQNESTLKKEIDLFEEVSTSAQEEFLNEPSKYEILDNQDEPISMKKTQEKITANVKIKKKIELFVESSISSEVFSDESAKDFKTQDDQYEPTFMKKRDQFEETATDIDCQNESLFKKKIELIEECSTTAPELLNESSKNEKLDNQDKPTSMKKKVEFFGKSSKRNEAADDENELTFKVKREPIEETSTTNIDEERKTTFEYLVKSQKEDNFGNENVQNEICKDWDNENEQSTLSKGKDSNNVTPESSKVSQIEEESILNKENKTRTLLSQDEHNSNNDGKDTESCSETKNYPGIDDHNYSNPNKGTSDFDQEVSVSSNDDVSKSEDDLRNIIRKQLTSLRNMKKSSGYFSDLKRKSVSFHSPKKKRKSCDLNQLRSSIENKNEENMEETENESNSSKPKESDNDFLISHSEETNFVIMNVTGGVDRLNSEESEENRTKPEEIVKEDRSSSTDLEPEKILIDFDSVATIRKKIKIFEEQIDSEESSMNREKEAVQKSKNRYHVNKDDSIPKSSRKHEEPVILTIKKNLSETFIKDPGVNKSVKNSEKSPFVSDSLEDFLNESSQLKISYSIPKLRAEEGLTENSKKSPYDDKLATRTIRVEASNENETPTKEKTKLIKAKTLAEMRRHMEKLNSKTQKLLSSQSKKIHVPKKEEPDIIKDMVIGHVKEERMNDISPHRNSFILFNRRKIWVPAKFKNRCVGVINTSHKSEESVKTSTTPMPKTVQGTTRKLSLLSCLNEHKKSCDIKYKPGPLCKKAELQNLESRSKWTTELKTLPKVYLEVFPEIGKPVDPQIVHLLPVFDEPVINEQRANFALSTLKTSKDSVEPSPFTFHIPYNNKQEKLVVRKPFHPETPKIDFAKNDKDPSTEIANILDDIIKYIETKEIEDTLIKNDDTIADEQEDKVNEANFKNKKRRYKRKKLELELRRLNCKVVDVDVSTEEDKECTKPYCKMGCVCTSLLCESVFSNHCQLVKCMFGCKCPPLPESEITTFNNSLPAHTVSHLEDKAKKHLAKVEREFTQTLINTGRDVILVGTGGRNRMRASKAPKKYTDYIADIDEVLTDFPKFSQTKDLNVKRCTVDIPKLNLEEIIPYCLCHKTYNCYCKGEMVDLLEKPCDNKYRQIPKLRIVKAVNEESQLVHESCARVRKVFSEYKERNKHFSYTQKLREENPDTGVDFMFGQNESDFLDQIIENETPKDDQTSSGTKRNKRKQSFSLRNEGIFKYPQSMLSSKTRNVEKEFAIQRRKKKLKHVNMIQKDCARKYIPIFDGEIKVSLKDNKDMLKFIGEENASLEYLRILPWTKVVESFRSGKLNIWSREKRSSALLCNAAGYFPPKGFMDIRKVLEKSDIITWILTDELPPDRPRNLMHLILTPKKNNFLISGFCLKKTDSEKMASVLSNIQKQNQVLINKLPNVTEILINTSSRAETNKSSSQTQFIEMSQLPTDTQLKENKTNIQPTGYISTSKLTKPTTDSNSVPTILNPTLLKKASLQPVTSDSLKFSKVQPTETTSAIAPVRFITVPKKVEVDPKLKSPETGKIVKSHSNSNSPESASDSNYVKIPLRTISGTSPSKSNGKTILIKKLPSTTLNSTTTTSSPRVNPQAVTLVRRYQEKLVDASVSQLNAKVFDKLNVQPSTDTSEALVIVQDAKPVSTSSTDNIQTTSDASDISMEGFDLMGGSPSKNEKVLSDERLSLANNIEVDKSSGTKAINLESVCRDTTFDSECHQQIDDDKNSQSVSSSKPSAKNKLSKRQENVEEQSRINLQTDNIQAGSQASCLKNLNKASAKLLSSRTVKCTHKDMYNNSKTLILMNKEFPRRELRTMDEKGVASKTLHLPLPKISKKFRWRMIYLNSDFSYLSFVDVVYSIKYTDLMDVVKMSNNINSTIVLRNKEFSDFHNHPFFGIYCVPGHQDRLFIGPYSIQEKHNIETLRYLQGKLIDTYIFNKMIGKKVSLKSPEWLYEPQNRPRIPNGLIIDITDDDNTNVEKADDIIYVVDNDSDMEDDTKNTSSSNFLKDSLLCPPFVEILSPEELRTKKINRYIVTNIPHLGYFGACQRDNKAIEVFWPNDSRGFRFPNVTFAKNSLILYLSQIFHPIPQDFKINVIILTHVDLQSNKPVALKYFSHDKSYICGEFGIYEKNSIPNDLLEHYQISSIESLLNSEEHSGEITNKMIRLFGLFLMSNEELRKHPEPQDIMQWAKSETYILKKLSDNYESEKADLRTIIRANLSKINERKRKGATNSNTISSVKSSKSNTSDAMKITATIEIEDSDEDDQTKKSQKPISETSKSKNSTPTTLTSKTTSIQSQNPKARPNPLQNSKTNSIPLQKSTDTLTLSPKGKEISVLTTDQTRANSSRSTKRKEIISDPKDSQEAEPIFKKICTNSKILSGGTVICKSNEEKSPQYSSAEERSVLKSKVKVKPARSLLKINDTDMRRYNITPPTSTDVPRSPVKISLSNNSKIIVHHSNVSTSKPNQNY